MSLKEPVRTIVGAILMLLGVGFLVLGIWLLDFVYPEDMPLDTVTMTSVGTGGLVALCVLGALALWKRRR